MSPSRPKRSLRRIAWPARVAALLLALLAGMTIAARDYEPYTSLKGTLSADVLGRDSSDAPVGGAGEPGDDPQAAALRRVRRVSRLPGSRPPLGITDRRSGLALRARLRRAVWDRPTVDVRRQPDASSRSVATWLRRPLPGIRRVDRILVAQAHGIDSAIEIQHPAGTPRGFVIVHGGHGDVEEEFRPLITALARSGYVIALMNMPLYGWNPRPAVRLAGHGRLVLTSHDTLSLLPGRPSRLLALFLDPVVVAVNMARRLGIGTVAMVGLSGGGWTTTLSAALDPRIGRSYDVAGSLPLYLRTEPGDQGDFEQRLPGLLAHTDYQDLYVLGALERSRTHAQVFNDRDPCCFALRRTPPYKAAVRRALRSAGGGTFDVYRSHNATHSLAEDAQDAILRDLAAR